MVHTLKFVELEGIRGLVLTLGITYLVLLFLDYAPEGPHSRFRFDAHHPLSMAFRLISVLVVGLMNWMLKIGRFLLSPLFDASAEVGEWVADHSSPKLRSRILSRFK